MNYIRFYLLPDFGLCHLADYREYIRDCHHYISIVVSNLYPFINNKDICFSGNLYLHSSAIFI